MRTNHSWAEVRRELKALSPLFKEATFVLITPCRACDGGRRLGEEACAECGGLGLRVKTSDSPAELEQSPEAP